MATTAPGQPAGIVAISRAVVSAAADLVAGMERAMAVDGKIRTAQSNAWDAVLADRARAQARVEMNQLVASLVAAPLATGTPAPGLPARPATGPAGPATSTTARAASGTTARTASGTTARAAARATARTGTGRAAAARPGQRSVGSSPRSRASHTARVSTGAAADR